MAGKGNKTTALVKRTERQLARGADETKQAARVERFGLADAATLAQMDAISSKIQSESMPANTKRARTHGAAAWVRYCAWAGIQTSTVDAASLRMFGTWLITKGRIVPKGEPERGYAEATARNRMATCLMWMRDVEGIELSTSDVAAGTKGISEALAVQQDRGLDERGRGQAREVSISQLDAMIMTVSGDRPADFRNRALLLVAWSIAARTQELANLRVRDIIRTDTAQYVIRVGKGKTKASARDVVVDRDADDPQFCVVAALDAWLAVLDRYGKAQPTDHLFPAISRAGQVGAQMTAQAARNVIKAAGKAAGVTFSVTGHSIRSGFVTAAFDADTPKSQTARTGGWTEDSRAMTQVYNRTKQSGVAAGVRRKLKAQQ